MQEDFSFHWPNRSNTYFVNSDGDNPAPPGALEPKQSATTQHAKGKQSTPAVLAKGKTTRDTDVAESVGETNKDTSDEPAKEAEAEDVGKLSEKEMTLKQRATSTRHLLTHTPKNPFCPSCQRAKLQSKPHRHAKTARSEAKAFGDHITGDHIVTFDDIDKGFDGERDAVVLYDVGTQYLDVYPVGSKSADDVYDSLNQFIGRRQSVSYFYTDAARELRKAAVLMGLCKDDAIPSRPESNGIAEEKVKKVLQGARTLLDHAGLESKYWPFAAKHFCF